MQVLSCTPCIWLGSRPVLQREWVSERGSLSWWSFSPERPFSFFAKSHLQVATSLSNRDIPISPLFRLSQILQSSSKSKREGCSTGWQRGWLKRSLRRVRDMHCVSLEAAAEHSLALISIERSSCQPSCPSPLVTNRLGKKSADDKIWNKLTIARQELLRERHSGRVRAVSQLSVCWPFAKHLGLPAFQVTSSWCCWLWLRIFFYSRRGNRQQNVVCCLSK